MYEKSCFIDTIFDIIMFLAVKLDMELAPTYKTRECLILTALKPAGTLSLQIS